MALDPHFVGPVRQGWLGCAKARGPVDQGSAAHCTALQDGDGAILAHAPDTFLIQAAVGLGFQQLEVAAGLEWAFFDQQHAVTGGTENFRAGGTARAAANDGDVHFQRQVLLQSGAVMGFPAAGDAFAKRIGYRHGVHSYLLWRSDFWWAGIAAMAPGCLAAVPGHHDQLDQRAMAHAQQAQGAVLPAYEEVLDLLGAGVFPGSPDTRQRAPGNRHGQYVEQLTGELEHLRRQVIEAVIQALQGAGDGIRHLGSRHAAGKQHGNQCPQHRQVGVAQGLVAIRRLAGGAATEAGAQPGCCEEGCGAKAELEQAASAQHSGFGQACGHCY
ncbi:hypothetical protein D3C80_1134490 [compost metagenome]